MLDGWIDSDDAIVVGDFRNFGYDQVLFLNRTPGSTGFGQGKVLITDFKSSFPSLVRYTETYGEYPGLDEFADVNDRVLVGDFMGLGYDQVLFVNSVASPTSAMRRLVIVDYSGSGPVVKYAENYGYRETLAGWHDPQDVILAGNFVDITPSGNPADQVLFINNQAGAGPNVGHLQLVDFHFGTPTNTPIHYTESYWQAALDPSLSNVAGTLLDRFNPAFFVVTSARLRGRRGWNNKGHMQVASLRRN